MRRSCHLAGAFSYELDAALVVRGRRHPIGLVVVSRCDNQFLGSIQREPPGWPAFDRRSAPHHGQTLMTTIEVPPSWTLRPKVLVFGQKATSESAHSQGSCRSHA